MMISGPKKKKTIKIMHPGCIFFLLKSLVRVALDFLFLQSGENSPNNTIAGHLSDLHLVEDT
jgi:hypothetical protein